MRVLYISYDGLMEPLGQSQVWQYLNRLASKHEVILMTYEKYEDWNDLPRRQSLLSEVAKAGVRWVPLRYHRRPTVPATAYDIVVGLVVSTYLVFRHSIQIVHTRSYVPSVIGLFLRRLGARFIFDMRGFWADEKVDAGTWSRDSFVYRVAKWFERRFLVSADVVVSLTHAAVQSLLESPYPAIRTARYEVIPTCTNLDLFNPAPAARCAQNPRTIVAGYVGSVDGSYLFEPVLIAFNDIRRRAPGAKLLILNRGQHSYIRKQLAAYDVPDESVEIKEAPYKEVADAIRGMDVGLFFYMPVFSRKATAPTKLGEFLGCGIPCLSNAGVGDVEDVVERERVGVVLHDLSDDSVRRGVGRLMRLLEDPDLPDRCVRVARKRFSLELGVAAYDRIYCHVAEVVRDQ